MTETPLWKKLGLRSGEALTLRDPPRGWSVPGLPEEITTVVETAAQSVQTPADTIIAFFSVLAALHESLPALAARIFLHGAIWVAWPRRAGGHSSDIHERDIRDVALPLGLVDVKVAALDEDWSGLRLVWRRERRPATQGTRG